MATTWNDCIGDGGSWLLQPLQQRLRYDSPLPVQQAVVPTVRRALLSGLPMDICLTAPTGSGKTLCYLLPMLRLVTECKKGVNHTRFRALVLVPTKTLGQQVLHEVVQLTRGTSITSVSLCGDKAVKEEADALVRRVVHVSQCSNTKEEHSNHSTIDGSCYYSKADIVVATPQRLLRHLDQTTGLSLVDLQLLVIDEADQVLAGNFSNFVTKVVERFEEEQRMRLHEYKAAVNTTGETRVLTQLTFRLHKILCSATLSSHIARISEVRLRNCRHFTLDGYGTDIRREDEGEPLAMDPEAVPAGTISKREKSKKTKNGKNIEPPVGHVPNAVRTSFALPPRLQEHIIFVEDWYRHAVLLKLVRAILAAQQPASPEKPNPTKESESSPDDDIEEKDQTCEDSEEFRVLGRRPRAHVAHGSEPSAAYPPRRDEDDAGSRILVFCRSADEARVMGHFLLAAGVPAVEFTTLASESERRRALLKSSPTSCVVASDALMRGVDVPNIGHVIMYSPPDTLSQYVHRAGRTARAMRAGHLHILLQKNGPSGSQEDGEVAAFKVLSAAVARSSPVRYERHFFMFDRPPTEHDKADATAPKDKARILIDEADELLKQTQTRLMGHWGSALESVQSQVAEKKRQQREEVHATSRKRERKHLAP